MANKKSTRNRAGTLSPAAKCWWQQIGDCVYLVIAAKDSVDGNYRKVTITDKEAYVLRDLLTNPDWWQDLATLIERMQGDQ